MDEIMLRIDNVSKMYKLGQIGGTTLRDELQRKIAKLKGQEDPTKKIGAKNYNQGETFMALNGVSFEVKKGERVGIIGHNGAGKSTLLKLISRVTAPTGGQIQMNGRVASMLEVGTGFHPELTGRENVYMNGAILGMTKKEIDAKMEDIIEFSEVRQFIDTPVKRYSSGMYVKLAFSVAAHLDSEIMIMDEVLAVGDVNFQQKCLEKMRTVAESDGRTILYVSHNMSTIRRLCNRCIVLNHGSIIYNGDVENAVNVYTNCNNTRLQKDYDISNYQRPVGLGQVCRINKISIEKNELQTGEELHFTLSIDVKSRIDSAMIRFVLFDVSGNPVGTSYSDPTTIEVGSIDKTYIFPTDQLAPNRYYADIILIEYSNQKQIKHDIVTKTLAFAIEETEFSFGMPWRTNSWGSIMLKNITTGV